MHVEQSCEWHAQVAPERSRLACSSLGTAMSIASLDCSGGVSTSAQQNLGAFSASAVMSGKSCSIVIGETAKAGILEAVPTHRSLEGLPLMSRQRHIKGLSLKVHPQRTPKAQSKMYGDRGLKHLACPALRTPGAQSTRATGPPRRSRAAPGRRPACAPAGAPRPRLNRQPRLKDTS